LYYTLAERLICGVVREYGSASWGRRAGEELEGRRRCRQNYLRDGEAGILEDRSIGGAEASDKFGGEVSLALASVGIASW
jgi:hypothetical protein